MRASSSITPIPIEAFELDTDTKPDVLIIGFLVMSVLVVIAGLLGAL
jgi:hypothetical protein